MNFPRETSWLLLSVWTLLMLLIRTPASSQLASETLHLMQPDTSVNSVRQYTAFGISGGVFVSSGIGLYTTWYSQFDQSSFHLFDDSREWNQMDKYGHVYTTYFQSEMCYKVAKWTGMSNRQSVIYGASCGFVLQAAVEVFDGFSDKWGFSVYDLVANSVGAGLFTWQQLLWNEQRIRIKIQSQLGRQYNQSITNSTGDEITTLDHRADNLFGHTIPQRFLKDYNAQTYWISINPQSFGMSAMPKWLNLSIGFGSDNLFGGFENTWEVDGEEVNYNRPRFRQFYFGPDIDFARFNPKNHWVKTLFSILNVYKFPMPAIQYNREHGISYHLILLSS